ncbi:MAG: regulatory protein RecX [Bacillota bacterium]|nr:regulatory protein RecX [Bacillota bacterium]
MRITGLEADPKGGIAVMVDGEPLGSVSTAAAVELGLQVGEELDEERAARLRLEVETESAFLRALRWLAVHPRSRRELEIRLQRAGWTKEAAERALARLERFGYVDDLGVARRLLEERGREWGPVRLRQELRKRGIPAPVIEEALAAAELPAEESVALELGRQRWLRYQGEAAEVRRRRVADFLRRRGFGWEVVERTLARLDSDFRRLLN